MDPQGCPCGVVCSIHQPGVHLPSRIKAPLEGGDNYIIWGFHVAFVAVLEPPNDVYSVFEPSDDAGKSKSRVDRNWVGDVPEGPRHTMYVVGVCAPKRGHGRGRQPWSDNRGIGRDALGG